MKPLLCALAFASLQAAFAFGQPVEQSPLVVKVTTDRKIYRLRRFVRITLTETNSGGHGVEVFTGCQILHASAATRDGTVVWTFRDFRLCLTGRGILRGGASRTFHLTWDMRRTPPGVQIERGLYTITAGVDGVSDATTIRLRRRR